MAWMEGQHGQLWLPLSPSARVATAALCATSAAHTGKCKTSQFLWHAQVQEVCRLVGVRGARLMAAAIAGILRHLRRDGDAGGSCPRNLVAMDGAVARKYTAYR
jgi:hexokinase